MTSFKPQAELETTEQEETAFDLEAALTEPLTPIEIPLDEGLAKVTDLISKMQADLESKFPGYASYLKQIHVNLGKNPELIHMLKPEQFACISKAMQEFSRVTIFQKETKAKASKKVSAKDVSLEEL